MVERLTDVRISSFASQRGSHFGEVTNMVNTNLSQPGVKKPYLNAFELSGFRGVEASGA